MATNWRGYLLKATKTNSVFPLEYIHEEGWKSTPKQREEIKAYRDDNTRNLIRVTAKGKKSKFAFATRANLTLEDKIIIQKFFTDAEELEEDSETALAQRKVQLTYWNDETNDYETSYFYIPNMDFTIKKVTDKTIIYNAMQFDFVEY